MKGWRAANSPQVHCEGGAMSNTGRADVPREPGEAECPAVTAGVEGGRRAGTGARATG